MPQEITKPVLQQKPSKWEFFRSGVAQWVLIFSLFVNLGDWLVLPFFIRPVDFPIVLHYNIYFGVDLIGRWWEVYYLPLVASFVLALNIILAHLFYTRKERAIAHLLLIAALVVQIGIAIAEAGLIRINY